MLPQLVLVSGLALLAAGWLVLRSFGPRLRVGRLLAATRRVSVAEARAVAEAGEPRYVAVRGRIDSDTPFQDPDHRPLVLRRTRLQVRERAGWRTLDDRRESVPFELRDGLEAIGVDADALDDGLVVVPRESAGTVRDLGERAPAGVDPGLPARLRIEQVSSVEHAIVLGVPVRDGVTTRLTGGLGRPLVLTTLEPAEAMRVLAEGRTRAPRAAAGLLAAGGIVTVVAMAWLLVEAVA